MTAKLALHPQSALRAPRPFVKWAGGKRQLLDILQAEAPEKFNRYFEPFVGGGALLFATLPKTATIYDVNAELINCYETIRDDVEQLLRALRLHKQKNNADHFYAVRAKNPQRLSAVQRAARFIYLNKTCFNGLYRENSKGQFNAPYGRYVNPNIADTDNLHAVSAYLEQAKIKISCSDFRKVLDEARAGDFVYFDPPYVPLTATASFTKYTGADFGEQDQRDLAAVFSELVRKNVFVMLSNSNTAFIRELYSGFKIRTIEASRAINCKSAGRGRAKNEVLIKSF